MGSRLRWWTWKCLLIHKTNTDLIFDLVLVILSILAPIICCLRIWATEHIWLLIIIICSHLKHEINKTNSCFKYIYYIEIKKMFFFWTIFKKYFFSTTTTFFKSYFFLKWCYVLKTCILGNYYLTFFYPSYTLKILYLKGKSFKHSYPNESFLIFIN